MFNHYSGFGLTNPIRIMDIFNLMDIFHIDLRFALANMII
jgi:hypothetical protein